MRKLILSAIIAASLTATAAAIPPGWSKIGLSAEQKAKVNEIYKENKAKIDELYKQIDALKADTEKKQLAVLTDAQRQQLADLITAKAGLKK